MFKHEKVIGLALRNGPDIAVAQGFTEIYGLEIFPQVFHIAIGLHDVRIFVKPDRGRDHAESITK